MKLTMIHGAPAAGKYTVGCALAAATGVPFVDNHATIDLTKKAFDFGVAGFWETNHALRVTLLEGATKAGLDRLITTAAYSHPGDAPLLQEYFDIVDAYDGVIEPVFLHCSQDTLMARVSEPSRVEKQKLATPDDLRKYMDGENFAPIPRDNCLELSTEHTPPDETALRIARHFQMPLI